ncbi:MAG: hypothetical protein KGL39_48865 [Patescibacteria group bacterium]|nr:hypothetical protein [Patescibacteria group bacterium]
MKWNYLRYIAIPRFIETMTFWSFRHGIYACWWLNIAKREPNGWGDEEQCDAWLACEVCGKGKITK